MSMNRFIAQLLAFAGASTGTRRHANTIIAPAGHGRGGSKYKGNGRMAKGTRPKYRPQQQIGASKFFRRNGCGCV